MGSFKVTRWGAKDLERVFRDAAILATHYHTAITMVVVHLRAHSAASGLDFGAVALRLNPVLLAECDGQTAFKRLAAKVGHPETWESADYFGPRIFAVDGRSDADAKRTRTLGSRGSRTVARADPPVCDDEDRWAYPYLCGPLGARLIERNDGQAPTFAFIEPYGFKGVSMSQLRQLLKRRSCEVMVTHMVQVSNRFKGTHEF